MKKALLVFIFSCCIFHLSFSQNPLVKVWDYRFGGMDSEMLKLFQQTSDHGFIIGGYSESGIGGDKTQNTWGGFDYWIVKIDSLGNKQWERDFGGVNADELLSLKQTSDGGYILGGLSFSGVSGNKTQPSWGNADIWIIKTDSFGNMQWDKDFGGTNGDALFSIEQTPDGGYILGGSSISGISGDKTQNTWGGYDFWIIKIDSIGNKLWDRDYGGTGEDRLYSLVQTSNGGYILGGSSMSDIGGDKTQDNWGIYDFWLVKIDSLGNKQWDKDFGGIEIDVLISIQQTSDNGYLLGGFSRSDISGDKSQNTWGGYDYWIIKTDSIGNKQWDKDFGGIDDEDEFGNISRTSDGGFLVAGTSYSFIGGNKSESNLGVEQTWVLKMDSLGNILWDKTIFSSGHQELGLALQTNDGCYAIASSDNGDIAGYRTQPNWDTACFGLGCTYDYWIVKFCETIQAGFASPANLCPGACIDFANLSFNATGFQWFFPGASPDTSTATNPTSICYANPGLYDVQLIATNANGSDTLLLTNYITVNPSPPAQSITQSGDTLSAITGAASYQWYFNGNIINGATNYFYVATQSGDYNVVATDSNGCEVEAVINDVLAHTPLANGFLPLAIYPNPVNDEFTIQNLKVTRGTAIEISIYNVLGEIVLTILLPIANCQLPTCSIDVSGLSPGMYWLNVSSEGKEFRSKFVKY